MDYVQTAQEMFYQDRIGKRYGCFEVTNVEYDWENHRQVWTLKCVHCGFIKQTHNGKDYAKGKNKGNCKCQQVKLPPAPKPPKEKKPRLQDHALYSKWKDMNDRCHRKTNKSYKNYGARGITVCDEWRHNFMAFVEWAEKSGWEKGLTIDRIDNDKGYSPDNCRWVPREFQNKNKRNVKLYDGKTLPDYCKEHNISYSVVAKRIHDGVSFGEAVTDGLDYGLRKAVNEMCKEHGVKPDTVIRRIMAGYSREEALSKNVHLGKTGLIEINGEKKVLSEWCKEYGITATAVYYRVNKLGMSYPEAITTPKSQGNKIDRG